MDHGAVQEASRLRAGTLAIAPPAWLAPSDVDDEPWGSLSEMSIYGNLHPDTLYYTGDMWYFSEVPMELLLDDWIVAPRDGGDVFGMGFRWHRPLEPGYEYAFRLAFAALPDLIAVDGNVVWELGSGYFETGRSGEAQPFHTVPIHYVPGHLGDGMIWCVRDNRAYASGGAIVFHGEPQFTCVRRPLDLGTSLISYGAFEPPYAPQRTDRIYTLFDAQFREPVPWDKPPIQPMKEALDYETEEIVVLDYGGIVRQAPTRGPGFLGAGVLPHEYLGLLADNGIRGVLLWGHRLPEHPEETEAADRDVIRRGLDTFYIDVPDKGRWIDMQQRRQGNPDYAFWGYPVPERIEDLEQWRTLEYLRRTFPSAKPMLLVGGELEDVQYIAVPPAQDQFERARTGYIGMHQEWMEGLLKNVERPDEVPTFEQASGAGYPAAYLLKAYDMAQSKSWGRQNIEVQIANIRGASRAYRRPMMLSHEPWIGNLWCTQSPEETNQILYLMYFSGADYLYHEFLVGVSTEDGISPNRWGAEWLNFGRFAAFHPTRGEPQVNIAVMRGLGDDWSKIYVDPTPGAWGDRAKRRDDETVRDYRLLNVFFADFGTHNATDPHRFCTGTPYGPVDMIPWDTDVDQMSAYELVILMGLGAMDEALYATLKAYVRDGGTLLLSVGQMRGEGGDPRQVFLAKDRGEFLGVQIDPFPGEVEGPAELLATLDGPDGEETRSGGAIRLLEVTPTSARVLAADAFGAPAIVSHDYGAGEVILYASEYMSDVDEALNTWLLEHLAEGTRMLSVQPESKWIEYTAWRKADTLILGLFNHGRIGFPSGNGADHGPWTGQVRLHARKLPWLGDGPLEAFALDPEAFCDGPEVHLVTVPVEREGDRIILHAALDRKLEVIVGPEGVARRQFYHER